MTEPALSEAIRGEGMFLTPKEAFEAASNSGAIIVDLRPEYETAFRVFGVPSVIYLPKRDFMSGFRSLPRDRQLILADAVGVWSGIAVEVLVREGYGEVRMMTGGMVAWDQDGLPVSKDRNFELTGQCGCKLRPRVGRAGDPGQDQPGRTGGGEGP